MAHSDPNASVNDLTQEQLERREEREAARREDLERMVMRIEALELSLAEERDRARQEELKRQGEAQQLREAAAQQDPATPSYPTVIDLNRSASDSSARRDTHSPSRVHVADRQQQTPHVRETDRRRQHYTYIPSTSSFSRERTPPPPIIIQQAPYPSTRYIPPLVPGPSQPGYAHQAYSHSLHQVPQTIYIQSPYAQPDNPPYYHGHGHSPASSLSEEAASTYYVAVDPFRPSKTSHTSTSLPIAHEQHPYSSTPHYVVYPYSRRRTVFLALLADFFTIVFTLLFDVIPRQVYLHFLLRLPSFYFSRVARIFEEAEMTMPEIEKMALEGMDPIALQQMQWLSPASANLKSTWEGFIDSMLREWKTLNIISVLLLSAIITILQIDSASRDPIARNCALFSLICALMSLLYGCMYIIRFSSMRKAYKALEWAKEAQKTQTLIWWNAWVLLAMPATWLAWSIILYIACIMAFVWRSGTAGLETQLALSTRAELGIRIAISVALGLGVLYFALILNTLRHYGDSMDKKFKEELERLVMEKKGRRRHQPEHGTYPGSYSRSHYGSPPRRYADSTTYASSTPPIAPYDLYGPHRNPPSLYSDAGSLLETIKIMDLQFHHRGGNPMPDVLVNRGFKHEDWERFISEESLAWDGDVPLYQSRRVTAAYESLMRPQDSAAQVLARWNRKYFNPRQTMGLLCHQYMDLSPNSPAFAIYLVDVSSPDGQPVVLADRFGPVPEGLTRIDIFDQPGREKSRRRILGRTSIFSAQNPVDGRVHFGWGVPDNRSRSRPHSRTPLHMERRRSRSRASSTRHSGSSYTRGRTSSRRTSYSPRSGSPHQNPPTRYHPTGIPPEPIVSGSRTTSSCGSSPSSSPPSRVPLDRLPSPQTKNGQDLSAVVATPDNHRTKSKRTSNHATDTLPGDFRSRSPSPPRVPRDRLPTPQTENGQDPADVVVTPDNHGTKSKMTVSRPVTSRLVAEPKLSVVPSTNRHSPRLPEMPSPPRNIVLNRAERHNNAGGNALPSSSRHLRGKTSRSSTRPAETQAVTHDAVVHVQAPRPRQGTPPSVHEAHNARYDRSPSPSFKSFSRSRSRSRSSSRSLPLPGHPPSGDREQPPQKRELLQLTGQEARDVDYETAGASGHSRGRNHAPRSRRTVDSQPRQSNASEVLDSSLTRADVLVAALGPDSPSHHPISSTGRVLSSGSPAAPGSSGIDGPWTRDRSSLWSILAPPSNNDPERMAAS